MPATAAVSGFQAFVDASAGSAGALFATVCLYPLDVAKTRKQAHMKSSKDEEPDSKAMVNCDQNVLTICYEILKKEGIQGLFNGLKLKASHTVLSSFTFFYWFSFLKTLYERRIGARLSTSSSLLLNAIAGAINMSMTLPLELLTTRQQINASGRGQSFVQLATEIYRSTGLGGFWTGYLASLVLVSNPAINFTVFDRLKLRLQLTTRAGSSSSRLKSLTMAEAFVLGAVAKAIATVLTYPIIRAKILMQAADSSSNRRPTMIETLRQIGRVDGVRGYYQGCDAQLFNTVLKSALLLMTKEQITKYTMRALYAMRRRRRRME